jgi:hypothetical protein
MLVKSSEIVIGDNETRVSPIKGKHSLFATITTQLKGASDSEQPSLFDK